MTMSLSLAFLVSGIAMGNSGLALTGVTIYIGWMFYDSIIATWILVRRIRMDTECNVRENEGSSSIQNKAEEKNGDGNAIQDRKHEPLNQKVADWINQMIIFACLIVGCWRRNS